MDLGDPEEIVEVEVPDWPSEVPQEAPRKDEPVPVPA